MNGKSAYDVLPGWRVPQSEIRGWCRTQGFEFDIWCDDMKAAMMRLFMGLRREFPEERWDAINDETRRFCKLKKISVPR